MPTATLTWTREADTSVTGYDVYRHEGAGTTPVKIGTVVQPAIGVTPTYVDSSFPDNADYFWSVTAVNAAGESLHSTEVDKLITVNPPSAPVGLAVVVT